MWNIFHKGGDLVAENVTRVDIGIIEGLEDATILTESGNHIQFSNGWYAEKLQKSSHIKPDYYNSNSLDLIEFTSETIEPDEFREVMKFNIKKYITRYDKKNGLEDLNKAREFLDRLHNWEVKEGHPMKCQKRKD